MKNVVSCRRKILICNVRSVFSLRRHCFLLRNSKFLFVVIPCPTFFWPRCFSEEKENTDLLKGSLVVLSILLRLMEN